MTNRKTLILLLSLVTIITSCKTFTKSNKNDKVIAEVEGKKLYRSQLKVVIPKNTTKQDSAIFAKNYIKKWISNQLLLAKAEMYLNEEHSAEIEMMLDNYRTSLMVFNYQQIIIQQKLDTVVSDNEILEYYNNHSSNFILDSCAVKAIFVQIPKSVPDKYRLKRWMRSSTEKDLIKVEEYCYEKAKHFDMGEKWIYFSSLMKLTPKKNIPNLDRFLQYNKFIESYDSIYTYYIQIKEAKLKDDVKPVQFVGNQIKNIILNHRKTQLINTLENNIYNDALNQNKFTIYTKN